MPVVNIDAGWLNELLVKSYTPEELTDALDQIGCDVEEVVDIPRYRCPNCDAVVEGSLGADTVKVCGMCGHTQDDPFPTVDTMTAIRLDLLAARPDLFDIGRAHPRAQGLPRRVQRPARLRLRNLQPRRGSRPLRRPRGTATGRTSDVPSPSSNPSTDRMLVAIMKLQENLHWGVGRDRKLASIGRL